MITRKRLVAIAFGVILIALIGGSFLVNKLFCGVWGLPFVRGDLVAVIKTAPSDFSEEDFGERYYKVFANGSKEIVEKYDKEAADELYYYCGDGVCKFLDVDIVSERHLDRDENGVPTKTVYYDNNDNEYKEMPRTSDEELLKIEGEFFEIVNGKGMWVRRLYRYGGTIFIVNHTESVWTGWDDVYTYDMPSGRLRFRARFSEDNDIVGIYGN